MGRGKNDMPSLVSRREEASLELTSGKAARHATIPEPQEPFDNESLAVLSVSSGKCRTALRWFEKAHRGVSRKNDKDVPYSNHIFGVAMIAASSGGSRDDIVIALGHDSIEDTSVTYEQLEKEFGRKVADGILAVTKGPEFKKIPLEEQAQVIIKKLKASGPSALRTKGADLLWNMSEIVWDSEEKGVEFMKKMFGKDRARRKVEHYIELAELIAKETEDQSIYRDLAASLRRRAYELENLAEQF